MKKLFISVPMRDKSDIQICKAMEKMHKIAEAVFGEELEVIPSYIEHNPPKDCREAVWYLGESIKKLAEADYFVGVEDSYAYNGCVAERSVANMYDIPKYLVPYRFIYPYDSQPGDCTPTCDVKC